MSSRDGFVQWFLGNALRSEGGALYCSRLVTLFVC